MKLASEVSRGLRHRSRIATRASPLDCRRAKSEWDGVHLSVEAQVEFPGVLAQLAQKPLPLVGWELDGLQEQTFNLIPTLSSHSASAGRSSPFSLAAAKPRPQVSLE